MRIILPLSIIIRPGKYKSKTSCFGVELGIPYYRRRHPLQTKTTCFTFRVVLLIRMAGRQLNLRQTVPVLAGTVPWLRQPAGMAKPEALRRLLLALQPRAAGHE